MTNISKNLLILLKTAKTVFSTNELMQLWQAENKKSLLVAISRAIKHGYLSPLRRGLYVIADNTPDSFELAAKMKSNSYISFETVLATAGVIHQWHDPIFLASLRAETIKNDYGEFVYHKLPARIVDNPLGKINKGRYFIATPERALCDKVYKDGRVYLDDISGLDKELAMEISLIYNKRVINDIKKIFYEAE